MTTVYLAPGPFGAGGQFFGLGGLPLNAGTINTYAAGGTTPLATYTTSAGSVQNANPIVLGTDGRPPNEIWITGDAYRFDLKDSLGNLIKTYDNLSSFTNATNISNIYDGPSAVSLNLHDYIEDDGSYNVMGFIPQNLKAAIRDTTTTTSVHTYLQNAIDAAKAELRNLRVAAGYYITDGSLDSTYASSPNANFLIVGEGKFRSKIIGTLGEAYPIIDMTGNSHGGLRNIGIQSTSALSLATAAVLFAKPVAGGSNGRYPVLDSVFLSLPDNGAASAICTLVIFNCDLPVVWNSYVTGPRACSYGAAKDAGVTSKFQTLSATLDSTVGYFKASTFIGNGGPAFEYTGGTSIGWDDCYFALIGAGSSKIMKVSNPGGANPNTVYARDIRTENQSASTGVAALYFDKSSQDGVIHGALDTDATGAAMEFNAGLGLANYDLNIYQTTGKMFAGSPTLTQCTGNLLAGAGGLGTVAAASYGNSFKGNITAASFYAALGAASGNHIVYSSLSYRSMYEVLVPPTDVSAVLRPVGNFSEVAPTITAYTGGSGEQLVYSYVVKGAMLNSWSGQLTLPAAVIQILGRINVAAGVNGRIRVNLLQGGGNVDILDTGAALPAGGNQGLRLTIRLMNVSGTSSRAFCELQPNQVVPYVTFTNTSATIVLNADFTLRLYITNTANDPYGFFTQTGTLV